MHIEALDEQIALPEEQPGVAAKLMRPVTESKSPVGFVRSDFRPASTCLS